MLMCVTFWQEGALAQVSLEVSVPQIAFRQTDFRKQLWMTREA